MLHIEKQKFIENNIAIPITSLLLKKDLFKDVTNAELVEQIEAKNKCKVKLPTWFVCDNCYYPNKLNIEQTSSEITAEYKANLVSGERIIDITGGFGVDSYYFSKTFKEVVHCELNKKLSDIVAHNFKQLACNNITCFNEDGISVLQKYSENHFDTIYIDPSRRHDVKGKVFLLSDCLPDVTQHLEAFLKQSHKILIKTSPLLDISNTINGLKYVSEIHIVAVKNEVKELLFLIDSAKNTEAPNIIAVNIDHETKEVFRFNLNSTFEVSYSTPLNYLYEPNSAILKSGGFNAVAKQYTLQKLAQHSHLYTSKELIDFPGRSFEVLDVVKYNRKTLKKAFGGQKVNITTRNFPKTVKELRKELQLKDGGDEYWFFTTLSDNQKVVIRCKKVIYKAT